MLLICYSFLMSWCSKRLFGPIKSTCNNRFIDAFWIIVQPSRVNFHWWICLWSFHCVGLLNGWWTIRNIRGIKQYGIEVIIAVMTNSTHLPWKHSEYLLKYTHRISLTSGKNVALMLFASTVSVRIHFVNSYTTL